MVVAGLRKLVMDRTARLMTRIAIRRVVLMVGILRVVCRCWEVRKGMERCWVLDGMMDMNVKKMRRIHQADRYLTREGLALLD